MRAAQLFARLTTHCLTAEPPLANPCCWREPMATHTTAVLAVVRAARPQFRNRADAVVFALHAALLAEGFVLVAVGDAAEEEPPRGAALAETGHDGWNAARDEYAFRYRREGAGAADGTVVLKALAAGAKLLVDAAPPSPGAVEHLELRYVSAPHGTYNCSGRASADAALSCRDGLPPAA